MKDRIKLLMEKEKLSPKVFADMVGIQPSAISHILSGRNKPSMDVVQKILNTFRTVSTDWMLLGFGPMYRNQKVLQGTLFEEESENVSNIQSSKIQNIQEPGNFVPQKTGIQINKSNLEEKKVERIIIYFSDNTFEEFKVLFYLCEKYL